MKEFIEYIAKNLVDKPSNVHVNEINGERTVICELRVGQGEISKIIGRRGQTIRSIQMLVAAVSARKGKHAILELLD
jgi:uncharacterized protein